MSKQIVAKNFSAQPIPANQKTTIKIAKGQHLLVQDIVQNQAKEAGNVVVTKQGQDLYLRFADGAEVRIEGFYNQCTGNACSVTVAGNDAGGYIINGDTAIGNVSSNGGHLVYAYGEQSSLMNLAMGDASMASALGNLGNGIVAYVPATDGLSMGWVASLVAAGVGLAVASKGGTQAEANVSTKVIISAVATDNMINLSEVGAAVSGTARANATVTLALGNGNNRNVIADANGNWTYTLQDADISAMGQGAETITASEGGSTSTRGIYVDTIGPNAPTLTSVTDNIGSITGAVAHNGSTDDPDVLVRISLGSNNAVAGDSIRLYEGANALGSVVILTAQDIINGYIDIQSGTLTSGNTYALSAKITDIAGNVSSAATAHHITIDTGVPAVLAITSNTLSNSATPTLGGTALSGSTVTVTVGGATYITTATGGNWSVNLSSATPASGTLSLNVNGSNAVSATSTNVAGTSSTAPTQTLVIDTTAPNAPSITSVTDNVGSITGAVANNGSTDDTDVLVRIDLGSNNAVAGDSVRLYESTNALGSVVTLTAQDITNGYIDIQSGALTTGNTYALSAKITDIAGNVSRAATAQNITVTTNVSSGGGSSTVVASINSIVAYVVGGPVVSGNDLKAIIYAANGTTVLGEGTINANGSVTVQVGSYTGVVIVKVTSLGANPDYMDEATGVATDLGNTVLHSVGEIITQNGTTTLNVNVLTSLAYLKAVQIAGVGQPLSSQIVANTNAAVADAFGLTDLLGETVVTTVNTSGSSNTAYNAGNGLSNAEIYGALLAALSGADSSNGGNAQTTINNLAANLTVSGSTGSLNATAIDTIIAGAQTADPSNSQTLVLAASNATTQTAANLIIDSVATDNVINAAETGATVTGTAAANASITLTLGNGNTQTVTANAQGFWSYTLQPADITAMGQGPETILVSDGTNASTRGVFVDTTIPTVSVAASTTTNAGASTISVTSNEAGTVYLVSASVTVTNLASITGAGNALMASATAAANSASSISTGGLTAGTYHAFAVDAAGNLSLISTNAVTVVAASGAAISGVALSQDSGSSATDFNTNVQAQTISGNLSVALTSNERVEISLDNGATWLTAMVTGTTFSLANADLSNGTNWDYNDTLQVRIFNTGLNGQAGTSYSHTYVYDSTGVNRPDFELAQDDVAPVVVSINNLNNLSAMPGNPAVTDDNRPELKLAFRGGANAGDILRIHDTLNGNTTQIGAYTLTTTDVNNGFFLFQSPLLADGLHAFSADAADLAGNTSSTTSSFDFYIDTSGITPSVPVISSSATLTGNSPVITGTASPGHLVTVNVGGAAFVTTVATNGTWSVNTAAATPTTGTFTPLSPGNSPLSVTVTGANGSTSTAATQTLNLSQGVATLSFSNDTGSNSTDFITSNASQTISGTVVMSLSATESVEVSLDNGANWTTATTTTGQNSFSLAGQTLGGSHTLKVRVVDSGTPGPAFSQVYVLDNAAPNAPSITSVTDNVGSITGAIANNGSTDDTDVLVRVTLGSNNAVAGDSVLLYEGINALGSAVTLVAQDITNGYIDIQSGTLTTGTTYALSAQITDLAGNISNAATAHNITVDTSVPVVSITSAALSNSTTPTVSGTATSGSTVTVTIGNAVYTVTATGGTWSVNTISATPTSYTSGSSLSLNANGNNTVTASVLSVAGVSGSNTPSQTLVLDTTAPTVSLVAATIVPAGNASVTASEAGTIYLVHASITPTSVTDITNASGALWNSVSVAANTATNLSATGLNLGTYHAYAVDAAGNLSLVSNNAINVEVGPVSVAFSADTGSSASDFITLTAAQTISGTLSENIQAGDVVEVSLDNGSTWTAASTTVGQNTYSLSGVTLAGSGTLQVHLTRNTVTSSPLTQAYILDNTAPNAPTITSVTDNAGSVTGAVANNGSTDDTDVLVRVTLGSNNAVSGDSIRLYEGANALGSAVTLVAQDITNGYIDIQSGTLTTGSTYALSAKITDIAGNVSNAATTHNITVDTSVPVVAITSSALSNSATPTVSGTATSGATVSVTIGNAVYTVTATGGNWSVNTASATPTSYTSGSSLSLNANGNNTVTASAVNALGVSSASTPSQTLVIDTMAPNAPTITSVTDNAGSVTGAVANNGSTDDTDVLVRVSLGSNNAVAGDSVRLYEGANALGSAVTLVAQDITNGYVTIQSGTLTTGSTYALSAKITDIAGNISNAATAHNITVDTSVPAAPLITSSTLSNSATPTLSGTAVSGSTVTVTVGGATYTTTATGGNWSVNLTSATPASGTLNLNANGSNAVSATSTNVAGTSSTAATQTLVLDTTAPNAPSITSVTDNVGSITGAIANNGSTDDTDVLVRVTLGSNNAVAGDSIRLYEGANALGSVVTLVAQDITNGYIDIQSGTLTTGNTYALSAKITDIAGNISNGATAHNITVDTSAPNAPTIARITDSVGTVTGVVSTGGMTDDTAAVIRVNLSNNAVAGDIMRLYNGANAFGSAYTLVANDINAGYVDVTPSNGLLVSGNTYAFTATLADIVGNVSSASSAYGLVVDTSAPGAPAITSAASSTSATPTISGTAAAGVTITLTVGGATFSTTANGSGQWSVDTGVATPTSGSLTLNTTGTPNALTVVATNQNGVSSTSATQNLVIDSQAPTVSLTTATIDNSMSATVQSDESGTIYLVDSSISIIAGVSTLADITGAAGHLWNSASATANVPTSLNAAGLRDGTYHAYAVDAAGNLSAVSAGALTIASPLQVLYYDYQAFGSGWPQTPVVGNYVPEQGTIVITAHLSQQVWVDIGQVWPPAQLSIDVGGATELVYLNIYGSYNYSGASNDTLEFVYTVYNGNAQDINGISINLNGISTNGMLFQAGSHTTAITSVVSSAITDISNLRIDTVAPVLSVPSSTGNDVTLQSDELGSFYLMDATVQSWAFNSFIANPNNSTFWKQVSVSAVNTDTTISYSGLDDGSYSAFARDAAGNWSQASNNNFAVDNNAPLIRSVALDNPNSPQPNIVSAGGQLDVLVAFSEAVNINTTNGTPTVDINVGGVQRTATFAYMDWSNPRIAHFTYTVVQQDNDANGVAIDAQSLALNGAVITDNSSTPNTLVGISIPAVAANPDVTVDNLGPQVISVSLSATGGQNGYLNAGDVVTVTVDFDSVAYDKNYQNTGSTYGSKIDINVGGVIVNGVVVGSVTRTALAVSGDGTTQFTYSYTIQAGDLDANGISVEANALATGSSFSPGLTHHDITDQPYGSGLVAGQNQAVADISTLKVDNTAPTASAPAFTGATGAQNNYLNAGDTVTFSVTLSEVVTLNTTNGTPSLKLNIGGTTVYASYVAGSSTSTVLAFSYTILSGQTDSNGIAIFQDGFELNGATLADAAGNTATITHAAVSDNASYMVDTTAPNVPTVTSATYNSTAAKIIGGTLSGGLGTNVASVTVNGATYTLSSGNFTSNNWSLNLDSASPSSGTLGSWADGAYNVAVQVADLAGNTSQDSSNNELTFHTTLPNAPTISSITDNVGSITGTVVNNGVSDDRYPVIRIDLAGTNAAAGYKLKLYNGTTVLGGYEYPLDSTDITNGYVDMNTGWVNNSANTLDPGARFTFISGSLTDQYYDFNVKLIDTYGNVSNASNTHQVLIDTQPPTATIVTTFVQRLNTANTISGHDIQVQSTEQGTLYLIPESVSVSSLSSITSYIANGANANTWKSTSVATANTNITLNLDSLQNGGYHLYAVDQAGNISARSTNYVSIYTPGDQAIYLGPTNGFLIAPHQDTSDGEWFYHWDKSGNRAADSADQTTLASLHPWLSYDSSMTTASGDIDATNRYGRISEVEVAMAQYGATGPLTWGATSGAWQWDPRTSRSLLTDLVNIYQPNSVFNTSWLWGEGSPSGWLDGYWTATEVASATPGQTVGENLYATRLSLLKTASYYPGDTEANKYLGVAVAVL